MADYQFNTNLGPAAQQGTSLGDLINMARGAQAFQQQGQLNPLQLQKAQMEVEQMQKMNPLAVRKAEAETKGSELELSVKKRVEASRLAAASATDPVLMDLIKRNDANGITEYFDDLKPELHKSGFSKSEASAAIAPLIVQAHKDPSKILPALQLLSKQSISPSEQVGLVKPTLTSNAAGQAVAANPVTGQYDVMGTPQTNPMGVRTQTFTDPVTGNIVQAPVTPQGTLGAPSNLMGGSSAPGMAPQGQANAPQAVPTGSTAETERGRATQAINNYVGSVNALTDASKPGHIPTQEFIAKKLLTYLKDPSVNTGPIADVLAGKSNQATLTSKEQEVLKLIQQRIQNLNPRTDADAQSKKDAYGSFRLKKDALSDLVRQDLGNIQNQKLLANGTMNAAGDPRNPNLPAVNNFQAEYSKFSKDPVLMQYMGIVGTGQKAAIDDHDKEALRKLMRENGLSNLAEIEQKRKQLVEMSGVK